MGRLDREVIRHGALRVLAFPFSYDTPDLANAVEFYRPTPGDTLLDAWVEVLTPWDETAFCDFSPDASDTTGLLAHTVGSADMSVAAVDGAWVRNLRSSPGALSQGNLATFASDAIFYPGHPTVPFNSGHVIVNQGYIPAALVPATITSADPFRLWVNPFGFSGGDDPGATQGEAVLYMWVATPDRLA